MSIKSFVLGNYDPIQNPIDPDLSPRSWRGEIPEPFGRRSLLIRIGTDLIIFDNGENFLIGAVDPEGGSNPEPPGQTLPNVVNYTKQEFSFTLTNDLLPPEGAEIAVFYTPADEVIVRNDFSVLSFDGITALLNEIIRQKETWKDVYQSEQGQVLLQMVAFVAEGINFMIFRRAQESYIKTARLRSSLIRLAELLSFRVRRKVGSKTTIRFSLEEPLGVQLFIPKETRLTSRTSTPFLTTEEAIIEIGELFVDVPAVQSEKIIDDVILPTAIPPAFVIDVGNTDIEDDDDFFKVFIGFENQDPNDFEEWIRVDNGFIESRQDDPHYEIVQGVNGEISVRFGDGVLGRIPPGSEINGPNSIVRLEYFRTLGASGNISAIASITSISSTFTNSGLLSAQNITIASGGEDEQSNEEIRQLAPAVFRTGDRGVTREDFITILKNIPGVVLANVWGENENNPPNYDFFNKIEIAVVVNSPVSDLDWANPSDTFISDVVSPVIEGKKVMTTKIFYVPSVEIKVVMDLLIFVDNGFSIVDVRERVTTALENYFAVGQRQLGESVFMSDICQLIENQLGVHHVDIEFLEPFSSLTVENAVLDGVEEGDSVSLTLEPGSGILPDSVFITYETNSGLAVIRDLPNGIITEAVDGALIPDPNGTIDGVEPNAVPGSPSIDYVTGQVEFQIPAGVGIPVGEPTALNIVYRARVFKPATQSLAVAVAVSGILAEVPVRPGTVKVTYSDDEGNSLVLIDDGQTNLFVKSQEGDILLDLSETREIIYQDNGSPAGQIQFSFDVPAPINDPTTKTNPVILVEYNSFLDAGGNLILFRDEFATFDVNFEFNTVEYRFLPTQFLAQGQ